ncbi:hypothetical protein [Thermus sediminis]|nr:hypothetical protein [Thermus sediminis]
MISREGLHRGPRLDLLADREAVVWRGNTLFLDPKRRWEVV